MRYRFHKTLLALSTLAAAGCVALAPDPRVQSHDYACLVPDTVISQEQRQGLRFTNNCNGCLAVQFRVTDTATSQATTTACYVPSGTRVIYWGAGDYQVLAQKACDTASREGFGRRVPGLELDLNYRTGKCNLVGDFAD